MAYGSWTCFSVLRVGGQSSNGFPPTANHGESVHGGVWKQGTRNSNSTTESLGAVCRWYVHTMATWARHPRGVSCTSKPDPTEHSVHQGDAEWWPTQLPGRICEETQSRIPNQRVQKGYTHEPVHTLYLPPSSLSEDRNNQVPQKMSGDNMWQSGTSRKTTAPERGLPCQWLPGQCNWENLSTHMQTRRRCRRWRWKWRILYLPYVKGLLETIQRMCRRMRVKTVFKSHGTLREMLMKVKTRIPEENRRGIVYQIPCRDCESSYIGETGRTL